MVQGSLKAQVTFVRVALEEEWARRSVAGKNEEDGRDVSFKCCCLNERKEGISLVVQWSRLQASTAGGTGSIPGQGIKILHATQSGQN